MDKTKPDEPLVEIKIYVEKSVIDACGGIDKAKLIAYWQLVEIAEEEKGKARNQPPC